MDKKVIILSGASGSGKSTFARSFSCTVCSADTFFTSPDGTYDFNPNELDRAHADCFRHFLGSLEGTDETVVVDNTNTRLEELTPYVLAAHAFCIKPKIITVFPWQFAPLIRGATPSERNYAMNEEQLIQFLFNRNTHGVPQNTIGRQLHNLRRRILPHRWQHEFAFV